MNPVKALSASLPQTEAVTKILHEINAGDRSGMDRLMPLIYDELRRIAHEKLRYERSNHTMSTTDLVNEAFIRLTGQREVTWSSRAHFYAISAQAMRRILINYAEKRNAQKRGRNVTRIRLDPSIAIGNEEGTRSDLLLALDESLERMKHFNARGYRVVEYRFFGGLTHEEIAEVMGLSVISVRRAWASARSWLAAELAEMR